MITVGSRVLVGMAKLTSVHTKLADDITKCPFKSHRNAEMEDIMMIEMGI